MAVALVGARVFDGTQMRDGHAIVLDGGRIAAVPPAAEVDAGTEVRRIDGLLAPGFIDVQVNGGDGVLFNDQRSVEGIRTIGAAHRRFGTTGFLPTFITDTRAHMAEAVEAVRQGMAQGVPGLLGVHLEGPFLNPARKGVHDPSLMRPIEEEDIRIMTSLGAGRTLATLAPEMVAPQVIERLAKAGVIVSAGHTAADPATLEEATRRGLTGFTHLFNAMPPLAAREPGPIGAALTMAGAWASVIADLIHVAPTTLRVALAAKAADRIMLVTDAMPSVGTDVRSFDLQGRTILREGGRLTTAEGTLAGSDLDMAGAVRNMVGLGVGLAQALRMASAVPAAFVGLDGELGHIAPGYRASLVLLDDALTVKGTWIDGAYSGHERSAL
jgi:N-acetylglucosamine-6-phosphate deacetylase